LIKDLLDGANQPFQALERHEPASATWADAGAVKRLADVDIAEPGHDPLVEQQQLDRGRAAREAALAVLRVEAERLGAEGGKRGPFLELVGADQVERAETPGIVERDPPPRARGDDEMIVLAEFARIDAPMPGHAEMEDERVAPIGFYKPVFRTAAEPGDARAGQPLAEIQRERAGRVKPPSPRPHSP